ncbi:MAG TPA: ABC transporter ATP-binding protein [Acetobacterium sp.]|nr:ABC transporter ATP-binding protein [Acetobacterium sp.]
MDHILISLNSISKYFGKKPILKNIDLTITKESTIALLGHNGSGKSTLIRAAMGLLGPAGLVNRGEIRYKGQPVLDLDDEALRMLRGPEMGMIFQNCGSALCPIRTIGEQLYETMAEHGVSDRQLVREKATALFEKIHLRDTERILNSYPFELSGGMNQRVGIVMAMLLEPELLFADEPTSALDVTVQAQVVREMMTMREAFGTGIVVVTHNIGVVSFMADTVAVMCKGKLVEYGKTREVIDHPQQDYTRQLIAAMPRIKR